MQKLVSLSLFVIGGHALASTVVGNPTASVTLVDGADVYVDEVEAVSCDSGSTRTSVEATLENIDEVADVVLPKGTWCGLVVHVRWNPSGPLVEVPVDGAGDLVVSEAGDYLTIELDESDTSSTLVP